MTWTAFDDHQERHDLPSLDCDFCDERREEATMMAADLHTHDDTPMPHAAPATRHMLDLRGPFIMAGIHLMETLCTAAYDPGPAQMHAVEVAFADVDQKLADLRRAWMRAPLTVRSS